MSLRSLYVEQLMSHIHKIVNILFTYKLQADSVRCQPRYNRLTADECYYRFPQRGPVCITTHSILSHQPISELSTEGNHSRG